MNFNYLFPGKPVSGIALPSSMAARLHSKHELIKKIFIFLFHVIILFIFLFSAKPAAAQLDLNFGTNFTKKAGTSSILNAKYLYLNVATGYNDFIVNVTDIQGRASLYVFNNDFGVNGKTVTRFQPGSTAPNYDYNASYVKFSAYNRGSRSEIKNCLKLSATL